MQSRTYIHCVPNKIKQVFVNIFKNAIEAMTEGGNLQIKLFLEGYHAVVRVQDNGRGVSKEVLDKMGEPFYSTKEKGTGLGLTICNKITH
jgi:signal transduction histidine kinase